MNFHEEATFKWSKDLECDPEIDEIEIPTSKNHENDSSPSEIQRENLAEPTELHVIDEPVELVNEPPTKRRATWCRDILRDAEKHGAPVGTSRKRMHVDRYSRYVALMSNISDSKPSSYEEAAEQQVWKYSMT